MVGSAIGRNYSIIGPAAAINSLIAQTVSGSRGVCYDPTMRQLCFAVLGLWLARGAAGARPTRCRDARRLYNQGQFDAAERAARDAARVPATADGARVVLGRIQLERYPADCRSPQTLTGAIAAFAAVDARRLDARERVELAIGLAEALYLDDRFGAAAALFESVLDASRRSGTTAHERVLDWWATAIDRQALARASLGERRHVRTDRTSHGATRFATDAGSSAGGLLARGRGARHRRSRSGR